MTAREPEKEYIITDHLLFLFETNGFWNREERIEAGRVIRSRPHPAPACKKHLDYRADSGHLYHLVYDLLGREIAPEELGDALFEIREEWAAARKAREDVLKELKDWLGSDREFCHRIGAIPACITHACVIDKIESLRQQDKGGQQG